MSLDILLGWVRYSVFLPFRVFTLKKIISKNLRRQIDRQLKYIPHIGPYFTFLVIWPANKFFPTCGAFNDAPQANFHVKCVQPYLGI